MRKFIFALMASLLSCSSVSAFWQEAVESSIEVGVGYRQDCHKWKREAGGCNDSYSSSSSSSRDSTKIKSELKWKDLDIWLIEGRGTYVTCDNVYLRGSVDYGWITSGKIKRSLEIGDFRDSFADSFGGNNHKHVRGNVWDGKLAIGYQFKWCDDAMSLSPVIGYGWNGTELRNGHDDYSYSSDYSSDYSSYYSYISSDYSSYSSGSKHKVTQRWVGPFIGIDLDYRLCCDWNLFAGYEYHWADYHAKEKRADFICVNGDCFGDTDIHVHGKNAWGNVVNFGVKWDLCDCWYVGLRGELQWWEVKHAHERRKLCCDYNSCDSHVGIEHTLKSRIKHTEWKSASVVLNVGMVF